MTTYAIGDIQGCFYAFQDLLAEINFDQTHDVLWLVGDLINRGNGSLEVLRWCYAHQKNIRIVLGNHDLHALVVAHGIVKPRRGDTLDAIFSANDGEKLLGWLRCQPMLFHENNHLMVHAGLLPQWQVEEALLYASEVESILRSQNYVDFLKAMYGNQPTMWRNDLEGMDRLRMITNAMTRLRVCSPEGEMEFEFKGELNDIPQNFMPWFDVPHRASKDSTIIFGHWSALGLQSRNNVYALDTGCLWGGQLTALNLETKVITQVPCNLKDAPMLGAHKKS
jgi:bis(5'-nucleosyl)-tetraphosphatase (symmetrical)